VPEITYGRWSPTEVMERVLDGTWVTATPPEPASTGGVLMMPTSIAYSGTSASISTLGSVSFTGVTSLSLNGVFTGDYDNYMIATWANSSGVAIKRLRLRASGTDESSASNYYTIQDITADGTTVNGSRGVNNLTNSASIYATQRVGDTMYFYGPYLAQPTAGRVVTAGDASSAVIQDQAWTHSLSNAYDGFTYFPSANNISGRIAVYGLKG